MMIMAQTRSTKRAPGDDRVGRKARKLEEPGIVPPKPVCTKSGCSYNGRVHAKCVGHRKIKNDEGYQIGWAACGQWPMEGDHYCVNHERLRKAQGGAIGEARRTAALVTYGDPVKISPHAALLEELYRTNGHVAWLQGKIAELEPDMIIWGTASKNTRPLDMGKDGEDPDQLITEVAEKAGIHQWMELYVRERKHLAYIADLCIRANIAERHLKVIEAQAVILAQVIQLVITDERLGIEAPPAVQSAVVRDAMNRMELLEKAA